MPIPMPLIDDAELEVKDIYSDALFVKSLILHITSHQNKDGSFGPRNNMDVQVIVTSNVIQAFIDCGLPLKFEKLEKALRWLIIKGETSPEVEGYFFKIFALGSAKKIVELTKDMNILKEKLNYFWANPKERTIPRPLFFLMALDVLLTLDKNNPEIKNLLDEVIKYYYKKVFASASELAYVAYVIDKFITHYHKLDEKTKSNLLGIITEIVKKLEDMQNNGLWEDSIIKSCYVIIDLSSLTNISIKKDIIKKSSTKIKTLIANKEWKKLEKAYPKEIEKYNKAKEIYVYSLVIRAISKATRDFKLFSIKLAHSFIEDIDKILDSQRLKNRVIIFSSLSIFSWTVLLSLIFLEFPILQISTGFIGMLSIVASIITIIEWMKKKSVEG